MAQIFAKNEIISVYLVQGTLQIASLARVIIEKHLVMIGHVGKHILKLFRCKIGYCEALG